jgi:hypothetical protein
LKSEIAVSSHGFVTLADKPFSLGPTTPRRIYQVAHNAAARVTRFARLTERNRKI